LRIGFSRAARLVDMMEADGLVSGAAGGKAREVLVKKDYFDEVDAQLR
jgi:S-DNA-T family DNA segregation ATPase FtsK/SpoIIIE